MRDPSVDDNLRAFDFPKLFIDTLGWDRHGQPLPVTIVEIGVPKPKAFAFSLTGIAQKRGAQVFLCPPDEYGRIPSQTTRRLIQDQVRRAAYHNVVIFVDAVRKAQVWQWTEQRPDERSKRVYEHRVENDVQATEMLGRCEQITFRLNEEARLTLTEVVQRLSAAFASNHTLMQRGRHGRNGLRAYNLLEMDKGIRFWWERVLRQPRLTAEQEYPLACAVRRGDGQALDLMVRSHLHLIARIAWRVAEKHECSVPDYLDLVQIGNLEMVRLAPGFDPNGGVRFQTFLTPRILKTLRRGLAGEVGLVPIPRYLLDMMPKLDERRAAVEDRLARHLGRDAFASEVTEHLAAEYQMSPEDAARVLFIRDGFLSWDALTAEWASAEDDHENNADVKLEIPSGHTLMHDFQTPSDAAVNLVRREQLDAVLNNLTPRERDVVRMRFGLDDGYAHTLEEVGQRFAVTRERVRQIELRALKKLRRMGAVDTKDPIPQANSAIVADAPATPLQDKERTGDPQVYDSDCDSAI